MRLDVGHQVSGGAGSTVFRQSTARQNDPSSKTMSSSTNRMPNEAIANGQILQEALFQLDEVHIQHHDDEQEQNRDGADIDNHQQHGENFSPDQDEQSRGIQEGQDQPQDGVSPGSAPRSP
jgi:hypothetical protein